MDRGLEEDAVLAGEGSGGVGVLPITLTFDGLLTLGMVIEVMATTGKNLTGLAADLPRFVLRKGELACPPDQIFKVLENFRARFAGQRPDCTDGVRVDWKDAWLFTRNLSGNRYKTAFPLYLSPKKILVISAVGFIPRRVQCLLTETAGFLSPPI